MRAANLLGFMTALVITLPVAQGGVITWGTPADISGPTDVLTDGTVVDAFGFLPSGGEPTVNGVSFPAFATSGLTTSITNGNVTLSTTGSNDILDYGGFGGGGLTGNYASLMGAGDYAYAMGSDGTIVAQPLKVTVGGLTTGDSYQIEIWVNDSRIGPNGGLTSRYETVDGGPTLDFYLSGTGNGQYVIGTFVAPSPSVSFVLQGYDTNGSDLSAASQLNALEVLQVDPDPVPEPSSLILVGLGTLGFWSLRRVRKTQLS